MPSSLAPTVRRHEHLAIPPSSLPFALYPHLHTARFHHFRAIVELDQPFRQTGNVDNQARFRACQATEDKWWWLQTCHPTCLSSDDNAHFGVCKYVVTSNDLRKRLNLKRLASSPVLKISDCNADICACDGRQQRWRTRWPRLHPAVRSSESELRSCGPTNDVRRIIDQTRRMTFIAQHPTTVG